MNRHRAFGLAATVGVVLAIALGFWNLGGHARQRDLSADHLRSTQLQSISMAVDQWYGRQKKLPANLQELATYETGLRITDPLTRAPYEYRVTGDPRYELCATFASETLNVNQYQALPFAHHSVGRQCFHRDAVRVTYP